MRCRVIGKASSLLKRRATRLPLFRNLYFTAKKVIVLFMIFIILANKIFYGNIRIFAKNRVPSK